MPWRGPEEPGEFPTLGYLIGGWMEANLVIPDGAQRGQPYLLTDEMWMHMLWRFRLKPDAVPHPKYPKPRDGLVYHGSQLRRPQKWGKDPFKAAFCIAHALGEVQFDGWDAHGEPAARPVATPWVQLAATSEEQTDNTYRPLYRMLTEGPLADTPGLDIGETATKLPNGDGWIEPVTSSATSRLGNPITHANFTEPHLMTERDGGLRVARAMKRNLTGMGGTWDEVTNAWDPTENSVAQQTAEAKAPGVYLDHRAPDLAVLPELDDEQAVRERIVIKYGDSLRSAGGWVDEDGIYADTQSADTGDAEARRYYLDEVTVGERDLADPARWAAQERTDDPLRTGESITLGFDGSHARDGTALIATRIRDGRQFHMQTWLPPEDEDKDKPTPWRVDRVDVDQVVRATFKAYDVWFLFADPYLWRDYIDTWSGAFPKKIVEFPTTNERRMDEALERWLTAFREGELTHDGHPVLTQHVRQTAVKKGKRKPPREDGTRGKNDHYLTVTKKKAGQLIDATVAAILSYAARGHAIEDGALTETPPPATARTATAGPVDTGSFFRPTERLDL